MPGFAWMVSTPVRSHEPLKRPSATPDIVSRDRKANTVATSSMGATKLSSIQPIVCVSVGFTQPASSAAYRNIPSPKTRKPSGTTLPYGRTTTRTCGGTAIAGAGTASAAVETRLLLFELQRGGVDAVAE